jgi:hypothetical protein
VSVPLFVSVVKDEARRFRQGCRRDFGFSAGRVPNPHPERRDPRCRFSGVPATKRSVFNLPTGPDHIVLYQKNIEAVCSSEAEVRHQIRQTLIHELGHYFGMTEEQLKDV